MVSRLTCAEPWPSTSGLYHWPLVVAQTTLHKAYSEHPPAVLMKPSLDHDLRNIMVALPNTFSNPCNHGMAEQGVQPRLDLIRARYGVP